MSPRPNPEAAGRNISRVRSAVAPTLCGAAAVPDICSPMTCPHGGLSLSAFWQWRKDGTWHRIHDLLRGCQRLLQKGSSALLMNRPLAGIFYRIHMMKDTDATRTLMSSSGHLADWQDHTRAGSNCPTPGTHAHYGC